MSSTVAAGACAALWTRSRRRRRRRAGPGSRMADAGQGLKVAGCTDLHPELLFQRAQRMAGLAAGVTRSRQPCTDDVTCRPANVWTTARRLAPAKTAGVY
jgi:hypothetical protein